MKICFVTILRDSFTEKSYQTLSDYIAISTEQAKIGVDVIIPIVLASILENYTASNAIQPIWWNSFKKGEYASKAEKTININIISQPFFDVKGGGVSWNLFRFCLNDLVALVSEKASIRKKNALSLIEISTPLIVGYLINLVEWEGWEFEDLIENLLKTKNEIIAALPTGLAPVHLGIKGMFFG